MTLTALIETHGYWLLALGCLLEGETLLLLAGYAAHRGYLDPVVVVGIRFAYDLRTAGPILLGTTLMPASRFALFNAIGALP